MGSDRDALLAGIDVSRETEVLLCRFVDLVEKWTARINLVSGNSLVDIWTRHVLDSAQLYRFVPDGAQHWADLGSGAGFPGLVICILSRDRPEVLHMTLVESDQRKAAFLRTAARELGLAPKVIAARIEHIQGLQADVLSARALGPLAQLLNHADRHLSKTGVALFPKGRSAAAEIDRARRDWRFDLRSYPSMTDAEAQILQIGNIAHV